MKSIPEKLVSVRITVQQLDLLAAFFETNNTPPVTETFTPFPLSTETAKRIATYEGKDRYYLAYSGETLVAFWKLTGWDDGVVVPSFDFFVDIQSRGKGFGKQILEHAIAEAKKLGSPGIQLVVSDQNLTAIHMYRQAGFVVKEKGKTLVMCLDLLVRPAVEKSVNSAIDQRN